MLQATNPDDRSYVKENNMEEGLLGVKDTVHIQVSKLEVVEIRYWLVLKRCDISLQRPSIDL